MSEVESPESEPKQARWARYFARFDDGALMRAAFLGVLIGAACVLGVDLRDLTERNGGFWPQNTQAIPGSATPVLPPVVEAGPQREQTNDPRRFVTAEEETLRQPIAFTLESGGLLRATGSIDPGAAERLKTELEARGEYIKRVSLNSPGGALDDAIAMARMLRENDITTLVEDGAICASSCPLMMAGGTTRQASEQAAIGLHQFYAATEATSSAAQAMADAQMTTARISRHLVDMGVDPTLWLHALDTPPRALYYLNAEEMERYRLVTSSEKMAHN